MPISSEEFLRRQAAIAAIQNDLRRIITQVLTPSRVRIARGGELCTLSAGLEAESTRRLTNPRA